MEKKESISITYSIRFQTPFHFGTGLRVGLIQRSVARDEKNSLYVPGSTLKGVLRERCEQIARLFGLEARAPHAQTLEQTLSEAYPTPDIITRIFGSRFQPGQLFFDDAQLQHDQQAWFEPDTHHENKLRRDEFRAWQTEKRTQVTISRLFGTAEPGRLYNSEYGMRSLCFVGCISGLLKGIALPYIDQPDQPGTYSLLFLFIALQSLDSDFIGGNKSTGAGHICLEITDFQVSGKPMDGEKLLKELDSHWIMLEDYYPLAKDEAI